MNVESVTLTSAKLHGSIAAHPPQRCSRVDRRHPDRSSAVVLILAVLGGIALPRYSLALARYRVRLAGSGSRRI